MSTIATISEKWDKASSIRYLKPGKTDVYANFHLTDEILNHIQKNLQTQEKMDWAIKVEIKNTQDEIIAEVEKILYIRRKTLRSS